MKFASRFVELPEHIAVGIKEFAPGETVARACTIQHEERHVCHVPYPHRCLRGRVERFRPDTVKPPESVATEPVSATTWTSGLEAIRTHPASDVVPAKAYVATETATATGTSSSLLTGKIWTSPVDAGILVCLAAQCVMIIRGSALM
jgi:hypothetical protein